MIIKYRIRSNCQFRFVLSSIGRGHFTEREAELQLGERVAHVHIPESVRAKRRVIWGP